MELIAPIRKVLPGLDFHQDALRGFDGTVASKRAEVEKVMRMLRNNPGLEDYLESKITNRIYSDDIFYKKGDIDSAKRSYDADKEDEKRKPEPETEPKPGNTAPEFNPDNEPIKGPRPEPVPGNEEPKPDPEPKEPKPDEQVTDTGKPDKKSGSEKTNTLLGMKKTHAYIAAGTLIALIAAAIIMKMR